MQWSLRGTRGLMISLLMAAPQATAKLRNIWFRSCRMAFTRRMEMWRLEVSAAPRYIRRMKTALTSLDATMTGQNVKP